MMVERNTTPKVYSTAPPTATATATTPSKPVPLRPSASPTAISHIIDPLKKPDFYTQRSQTRAPSNERVKDSATSIVAGTTPVDVDPSSLKAEKPTQKGSSGTPSNAPSPKPVRAKEQPPPLPQGSGLLSSALFGNAPAGAATTAEQAPSIMVHVKLKNNDNNIINFAQLAEEKYGFAALHPRLAAQKERLARVAAAGAALEKSANGSRLGGTSAGESGDDDLSVDIDRDSDNEGDMATTGVNGGGTGANSGTDATGPTKKQNRRRKKMEEYDQDDPFVDDSELAWEAQAAAVKDGFFVYCGPLVAEGEKPAMERYVLFLFCFFPRPADSPQEQPD
jgi:HPC2 and ubinuclein domain